MSDKSNTTDRRDRNAQTDKPFKDEVEHPDDAGRNAPRRDDNGDRQREREASKTTKRTE